MEIDANTAPLRCALQKRSRLADAFRRLIPTWGGLAIGRLTYCSAIAEIAPEQLDKDTCYHDALATATPMTT